MKKRTAWVLVAAVAAIAIGAALVGGLALVLRGKTAGESSASGWSSESYLAVNLSGELPEAPSSEISLFERRPPSVRTIVQSLDRAATDPKVTAVVLRVSFLDAGWGKVQEIRDAVTRFRKSGKPVYAHLEFCGNKEYYLATAASRITAVPQAILDITGLRTEVTFLKGTLDKLGVEAQFEGIGKYKNAPNQFTETGFTEPHREQMVALIDSLFQEYLSAIAQSRKKTKEEVQQLIDAGPYDGRSALAAGLVDDVFYEDQVHDQLKKAGETTPARYLQSSSGFSLGRPKVALVYAVGDIVPGRSQDGGFGSLAGSDTITDAIRQARKDDEIKAIVLRVDSPGGSGTASDVIWREVQLARKSKPVIVSMGDVAASGGYYIATGSDAIVAQPGTITGSIGVFSGKFSLRGFYEKIGMDKEILSRGAHAELFTASRPWTDEERAVIYRMNERLYREFVTKVAEGRKKTWDEIHAVAQGRVWTGEEARRQGLVDQLGGMDVAVSLAKQKASIGSDKDVELVVLPRKKGFLETVMERQEESGIETRVPEIASALRWVRVLGDGKPLARLPFDLAVR